MSRIYFEIFVFDLLLGEIYEKEGEKKKISGEILVLFADLYGFTNFHSRQKGIKSTYFDFATLSNSSLTNTHRMIQTM